MSSFASKLDRIGPLRFALLLVLLPASLFYFAAGLYAASGLDPLQILQEKHSLGDDFVTFWAASHLALEGTPALAYDPSALYEVERAVAGPETDFTAWHYPPTFMLALMPFGLLPYPVAVFIWLAVPMIALAWLTQRHLQMYAFAWALPLFPASVICLVSGQNGFLMAFLIGSTLLHLDRRPILAGVYCGLLTWKPHLAALLFAALVAGGYWRVLASASATALALVVASIGVLGLSPWHAFFGNLSYVSELLESGNVPWMRMPSIYVSARLFGLDATIARIVQAVGALAALSVVCTIWYRGAAVAWRGAALAAALPLVTPYVFDYDLVFLSFAVAWLVHACIREGWQPGDTLIIAAIWMGPALSWPWIKAGGLPFMPLVFALLLAAVWRRAVPRSSTSHIPVANPV